MSVAGSSSDSPGARPAAAPTTSPLITSSLSREAERVRSRTFESYAVLVTPAGDGEG